MSISSIICTKELKEGIWIFNKIKTTRTPEMLNGVKQIIFRIHFFRDEK